MPWIFNVLCNNNLPLNVDSMSQRNLPTQRSADLENASLTSLKILRDGQYIGTSITLSRPFNFALNDIPIQGPALHAFAELHAERMHLLNCLQFENRKATDILRKTLALEDIISSNSASLERGDSKKKLGWLRCYIEETYHRERAILTRLGQLSFEIQAQDRWMQVEAERHFELHYVNSSQGQSNMRSSTARNNQPGVCCTTYGNSIRVDIYKQGNCPWPTCTLDSTVGLPTKNHIEVGSVLSANLRPPTEIAGNGQPQTFLRIPRSSSMDSVELAMMGTSSSFQSVPRTKRRSL